eukprot:5849630-Amphidinium_carterae.1
MSVMMWLALQFDRIPTYSALGLAEQRAIVRSPQGPTQAPSIRKTSQSCSELAEDRKRGTEEEHASVGIESEFTKKSHLDTRTVSVHNLPDVQT